MNPAHDVIDGAIAILKEKGWCQGKLEDAAGQCCLVGAVRKASRNLTDCLIETPYLAEEAAWSRLAKVTGTRALALWNDRAGRTKDDVIYLLEAAKALEL